MRGEFKMKTGWKIFAGCILVAGVSFFVGHEWNQLDKGDDADMHKTTRNVDIDFDSDKKVHSRKFASGAAPHDMIKELNNIFYSINGYGQVLPKSREIVREANRMINVVGIDDPVYPALKFYLTNYLHSQQEHLQICEVVEMVI